jgi:hypothetical protein
MSSVTLDEQRIHIFEKSLRAIAEFRSAFGRGLREEFVAELYVARRLGLTIVEINKPGYDALGPNGERYQIKCRSASTLNVDINSFDFDYLVLVNLDGDYLLSGMWRITTDQAKSVFVKRESFRKYQATQTKIRSIGEDLLRSGSSTNGSPTKKTNVSKVKWKDIRGLAPYPLMGEDAQAAITRSRQEDSDGAS